ncbi:MAG: hypothetical protein U0641_17270 [Anaerolineae bacterium]
MSHQLTLSLSDQMYEAVKQSADAAGRTPEEWITTRLANLLSEPTGARNDQNAPPPLIHEVLEEVAVQMGISYAQLETDWHTKYGPHARRFPSAGEGGEIGVDLARFIGAISLGRPLGAENDGIDADLAREYDGSKENGA